MSQTMRAPPEDEIAREIVDAAFEAHTRLGPGLLESVYELANLRLGILINFGAPRIKDGITRLANGLPE